MATASGHRMEQSTGMGPRKTLIIMVTVVGCVAILWPKVFYPMMVGNGQNKNVIKDHRGAGCCGVVLDQETFANASISYADQQKQQQQQQQQNLFRKRSYAPFVEIESIRQERPPHLRPEAMHPAMRERGSAIHGGERPHTPPRIVEGRPGPIPGMRPPMGAGSHQATKSANSMGFIMPLYTIGIVSFFIYTIMKLIFKKTPATPYAEVKPDPAFRNEVFTTTEPYIKRPDDGTTKLGQSVSASTSVTNAELVAPVASSASAVDTVASVAHSSVQSELSNDYEQLAASQPLPEQFHQSASNDDVKPETILANGLNGPADEQEIEKAEAATPLKDEQPPHDPTTEKVVDGIVVKKVVSFEEVSAGGSDRVLDVEQGYDVPDSVSAVTEEEIVVQRVVEQTAAAPSLEIQQPKEEMDVVVAEPIVSSEVPIEDKKQIEEPIETVADESEGPSITEQPAEISTTSEVANESAVTATEPTSELITFEEPTPEATVNEIVQEESAATVLERSDEEQQQTVEETVETTPTVDEIVEKTVPKIPEEATITVEEEIVAALKEESEPVQPEIRAEHESVATIEKNEDTTEPQAPVEEVLVSKDLQSGLLADALREDEATNVQLEVQETTAAANVVPEDDYPDLVIDNEMAIRVNETVEDITHAAEQLVCEVLEKAEELAKQQEEGEQQYPELPAYDPATQKLVDGIVIERFDPEVTKDAEIAATSSAASAELGLDVADQASQFVPEDDGPDVDSISEDTSLSVASVIEQQPLVKEGTEEVTTLPEALITTELLVDRTSSEPVIVDGSDQPTVETENVLEPEHTAGPSEPVQRNPESSNRKSVSIEEVHDDAPIADHTEGKVIEEHIIPISIAKEESAAGAMTITEVSADEPFVESPHDSKTASTLSSPLVTAVPVMDVIDEQQEQASEHQDNQDTGAVSVDALEHVTKEALVERTLNEAAAVVNEIESIVDHIITEKLIQSGGVPVDANAADTLPGGPPRLAASAALVVEAIESKSAASASVPSMMVSSSISNQATLISTTPSDTFEPVAAPPSTVITNGLTNLNGGTICDTNQPTPDGSLASESSTCTITASLDASFPIPVIKSPQAAIPESVDSPVPQHAIAPASTSETQSIHFAADPPASKSIAITETGVAANGSTGSYVVPEEREIERHTAPAPATATAATATTAATAATAASTSIGQVPTSVSNVTNPKFFTLNLANYSTSNNSSGNNSNRSSFSIPNLSQSQVALPVGGGDSADQLMELELLRKKLDETERAMTKIIANMGNIPKGQETNVTTEEATAASSEQQEPATEEQKEQETIMKDTEAKKEQSQPAPATNGHAIQPVDDAVTEAEVSPEIRQSKGKRDRSTERGTVKVMAMEVTAQRENGKRLSRPMTPLLPMGHAETTTAGTAGTEEHETRSILLDGRLPHDSKILVADAETAVEKLEPENSEEEEDAPVILSGKMTLSLINMDFIEKDATGTVAVGEIVTELHKPQEEITTGAVAGKGGD
ncbi:titin isoform X2 [Anopheles aquasalis]|uniref:titin isoform X2 n=1 Tax=Anopheles aquasalis TaxID=42839 RepID=UPI00215AC4F0|nr:titin isoform X2 [Anopheles aquasalis]